MLRKSVLNLWEFGQHCACQAIYLNDSEAGFQSISQIYYANTVKIRFASTLRGEAQTLLNRPGESGRVGPDLRGGRLRMLDEPKHQGSRRGDATLTWKAALGNPTTGTRPFP